MFDPTLRFAFTNITGEDFVSAWNSSPITVKPGQTIEVKHHLAVKFTKELVDKIMIGEAKMDELKVDRPYYQSPKGMSLGVPELRKVWEDKILRPLKANEESPEIQIMRSQLKEELERDMSRQEGVSEEPLPTSIADFADVTNKA